MRIEIKRHYKDTLGRKWTIYMFHAKYEPFPFLGKHNEMWHTFNIEGKSGTLSECDLVEEVSWATI